MGYFSWELCESYKRRILYPSLQYFRKSVEEFDEDVEKAHREEIEKLKDEAKKLPVETSNSLKNRPSENTP
jgi:hypothetical protein